MRSPWAALFASHLLRPYQRGDVVLRGGEPRDVVTYVDAGLIRLCRPLPSGREITHCLVPAGALLCPGAMTLEEACCCSAIVISERAAVRRMTRRQLRAACASDATLDACLRSAVARRSRDLCDRLAVLAAGRVEQRIASLFLRLCETEGERREGRVIVPLSLRRQDIADLCGTSVETATRVMARLDRSGVIVRTARGFSVADPDALARLAETPGHAPHSRSEPPPG